MTTIKQLLLSDRLPSPKGVALAVTQLCNQEDVSLESVVAVLKTDPALSGRLIKLGNAAVRGARPVVAIQDAVMRLGLGTVKQVSLGFSLMDHYRQGACKGFDYGEFWSHSLLAAIVMKECGSYSKAGAADELFALGLLAQVGQLALATVFPEAYDKILDARRADPAQSLARLEEQTLETNHLEVTAALLADWGIPPVLIAPVLDHEEPGVTGLAANSRGGQLALMLNLSEHLADLGRAPEAERHRHIPGILLAGGKIGLDADAMGQVVDTAFSEWREWSSMLHVPSSALPSFGAMSQATAPRPDPKGTADQLRILVVDDDRSQRLLLQQFLAEGCGHTVHAAATGREALAMALELSPQVVITDWVMPEMDGLELCRALRASELGRHMYVLMLTAQDDDDHLVEAYEVGVDAYVPKPINMRALRAGLRAAWRSVKLKEEWDRDRDQLQRFATELAVANRRLEKAALTDLVTALPNRRAALAVLDQAWSAAVRSGQPLSVLVIDIDGFKKINDLYGHAVGDVALREVAVAMRSAARREESLCRLGGEEFLVVCPNTDLRGALQTAERLRTVVAGTTIAAAGRDLRITVSVGVAGKEASMVDAHALVRAADEAMYGAKRSGRNRSCLSLAGKVHCGET